MTGPPQLLAQFICQHPTGGQALPRPTTLDVDLGVALGASAGQYGTLSTDLRAQGFKPSTKESGRFEKDVGGATLYIDFLVEDGAQPKGTRMVDDVLANVMPGVARALELARPVSIEGKDLFGATQRVNARVCEVGPYLALKLRAFLHRQQGKDAFDILYTLMHYDRRLDAAVEAFAIEAKVGNLAMSDAKRALETLFVDEASPGPVKAAHFVFGQSLAREPEDLHTRRIQVQQDMLTAAQMLLKAI